MSKNDIIVLHCSCIHNFADRQFFAQKTKPDLKANARLFALSRESHVFGCFVVTMSFSQFTCITIEMFVLQPRIANRARTQMFVCRTKSIRKTSRFESIHVVA